MPLVGRGLLDQRGNTAVRELRAAHGRLLAANGFHEEAVEELCVAAEIGAIVGVYSRTDTAVLIIVFEATLENRLSRPVESSAVIVK